MTRQSILRNSSCAFIVAALGVSALTMIGRANGQGNDFAQQQRGRYLAAVGDCAACHTAENGAMLAGGRPIETPFGIIYSPNITPDTETGIGSWTSDQFYHAMHDGIAADGSHLYPAFPYPWFTKATRDDIDSLYAYLRTVPAAKYRRPDNTFPWPLNDRTAMIGWNKLYFTPGTFRPDPKQSAQWNRGAYLVEGLGHCGACHTPKNVFGADKSSEAFQGSDIQHWFAPDLTGDKLSGLGSWSQQDIAKFLKTGKTDRTVAYGPMAEVVERSTSKMSDDDLTAIAVYLKSLSAAGSDSTSSGSAANQSSFGATLYADACSACHQKNGEGVPGLFPSLKGDAVVQSAKPTTVIRLILNGGQAAGTKASPTMPGMPAFGWKLSDDQIAAVATYVRGAWVNKAASVSASDVSDLRKAVKDASSAN
jgi:mono/diheme cytochrome c family protein